MTVFSANMKWQFVDMKAAAYCINTKGDIELIQLPLFDKKQFNLEFRRKTFLVLSISFPLFLDLVLN